jgi:pimeloyl-ACP methyl ester carboxylesterase
MLQTLQRSKTPSGVAFIDQGQGEETLVLIHGVGMRIEAWTPQITAFAGHMRVIAVDLPGHGLSAELGKPAHLSHFVEWFCGVLDELTLGPVNVAGHSMGALIATGVAATAPQRLRRVALLNSVHRRSEEARRAVTARASEIVSGTFDRQAPLARWFAPAERGSEAYSLVRGLLETVGASGYATAYKAFATGDSIYSDCWPRVTCPALFLTGSDDPNSTAQMAEEMARAAPCGRAVIIPGHRHMVNLTAPEGVNEALSDWLTWEGSDV